MQIDFSIFSHHFWAWLGVVVTLSFMAYTAWVIKNEKKAYIKDAYPLSFHQFHFQIPKWWELTQESEQSLRFERTDTRYDWRADFHKLEKSLLREDIEPTLIHYIKNKNIEFDEPTSRLDSLNDLDSGITLSRIEGTATQNGTERLYYDACLLWNPQNGHGLLCESTSSILNGMVEGPFFEDVIEKVETQERPHR